MNNKRRIRNVSHRFASPSAHIPIHTLDRHSIDQRQEIQFTILLLEKCHRIKVSFVIKLFDVHLLLAFAIFARHHYSTSEEFSAAKSKLFSVWSAKKFVTKKIICYHLTEFILQSWCWRCCCCYSAERSSFGNGWWTRGSGKENGRKESGKKLLSTTFRKSCLYIETEMNSSDECNRQCIHIRAINCLMFKRCFHLRLTIRT